MTGNEKNHPRARFNHSLFQSLIENIQDMIGIIDRDGIVRYASPSLKKFLGYEPAEVIEKNIFKFIHPDERNRAIDQFNTIRDSPAQARFPTIEMRIRHKDGSWRYLESTTQPLDLPDIKGFVINARDITSRKESERTLRQTLNLLQDIMDGSPSMIFVKDLEGRFLSINSQLEKLLGRTRDQILGKTDFDIFSEEWAEYYQEHDRRVLKLGRPEEMEEEVECPDGKHVFLANKFPLHDAVGKPYAVCGISIDITVRKKQEEELRKANRTLRAISDINQVMIRSTDEQQLLEDACRIIVEDCGYSMVWIGYAREDKKKTVFPAAYAGFEDGYLKKADITWADSERGRGPTGSAIRTGKVSVSRDILNDPAFAPWREEAAGRGYSAVIALPLFENEKAFGALTIYSRHPDPFTPDEVKLLRELAGDLEFGISNIRLRTAKERAEEKTRMNEERLELAMKSGHAGSFEWNAKQDINLWSDELLDLFGMKREQFGMKTEDWLACILPEDRESSLRAALDSLKTGEFEHEFRIRRQDNGEIRWIHGRGRVYFDADGNPDRMLGINFDITPQKDAETELLRQNMVLQGINRIFEDILNSRTEEDLGRTILDVVESITGSRFSFIGETGPDGFLHDLAISNPGWEACTMYDRTGHHRFFEDLPIRGLYGRVLTDGKTLLTNDPSSHPDSAGVPAGHPPLTAFLGVPLVHDGKAVGLIAAGNRAEGYRPEDRYTLESLAPVIMESLLRKRSENEKKKLESQLTQSQKMEALGTLAGGVAHDFNNILTAIMGYIELARMNAEAPEKADRNLESALKSCKRARDLVGQILSFSRHGGSGFTWLTLSYTVEESLNMLRSLIPSNIEIRKNLDANSKVNADPSQINQMIINLSVNAAQAMGVNGGVLNISLDRVRLRQAESLAFGIPEGPYLRIRVQDSGPGIPPEIVEHIFEPYFTTKKDTGSTGLGLSSVHGIVKRHAGAITVKSVPGSGATFEIYLPETDVDEDRAEEAAEAGIPTGTERILFVDDEEALVEVAESLLSSLGYKVSAFTGSLEALDFFKKNPGSIDLVVTDMTMPDLTGDLLAMEILKIRTDMPVIMYTGYSEYITEERARSLGIRKFILKPFEIEDLARSIRRELDRN